MKKILLITALFIVSIAIFSTPLRTHAKVLLMLSQEFPQIPVKPLDTVTREPRHETFVQQGVVIDLFLPDDDRRHPAVMLAMGVRTQEKDKPLLLGFADTMARLGYVAMWPRRRHLDEGGIGFESPSTFADSVEFLASHARVDPDKISLIGFSVGSSITFVAAADPSIASRVRSIVFFGGYTDVFAYLESLEDAAVIVNGTAVAWEPREEAVNHARELFQRQEGQRLVSLSGEEKVILSSLNPHDHLQDVHAKIFILHDRGDRYVPYIESVKLRDALPPDQVGAFELVDLFDHVQPQKGFSRKIGGELFKLYGFVYDVFAFL